MSESAFQAFLDGIREAKGSTEPRLAVEAVAEQMRRLLASSFYLDEEYTRPQPGSLTSHVLHEGADFVVTVCAWSPGESTPIHDHDNWGVVGGLRNRIVATGYRRLDEGDIAGFADVSEVSRLLISETSFACMRPPDELIHRLENPFKDAAVTLHVFGSALPWQHTYDPPAKAVSAAEPAAYTVGV